MNARGQMIHRGDRKWLLRVYLGRDPEGKRKYVAKTFAGTKPEARQALTKMLRDSDTNMLVRPSKLTVCEYLTGYPTLEAFDRARSRNEPVRGWLGGKVDLGRSAREGYCRQLRRYALPTLGHLRLDQVTPQAISALYQSLSERISRLGKPLSRRTIEYTHSILHEAFEDAIDPLGYLVRNPARKAKLPKKTRRPPTFLTPEEVGRVLATAASAHDPYYALWHLLLHTGFRPGEALALQWSDLQKDDQGNWTITVNRTLQDDGRGHHVVVEAQAKTEGSRRTVTVPQSTHEALQDHRRQQAEDMVRYGERYDRQGFIFASAVGTVLDLNNVSKRWKTALKRAGITKKARFYDTRHSHATALLSNGVDIAWVSQRLGHKSISTTLQHYAYLLPEANRKMADVMEQVVKKASAQ